MITTVYTAPVTVGAHSRIGDRFVRTVRLGDHYAWCIRDAVDHRYDVQQGFCDRDDLPDGGAAHFAETMRCIQERVPGCAVEVLIPDFKGDPAALATVMAARPEVLNHNLETTESLYPAIRRPRENYRRSLGVLANAKKRGARTKSGLMIGLGENEADILKTFADLRRAGCDLLTVGQYLQPTAAHPPVAKYYTPEEFEAFAAEARRAGFREVVSGPLVRSSYEAGRLFDAVREKDGVSCAT